MPGLARGIARRQNLHPLSMRSYAMAAVVESFVLPVAPHHLAKRHTIAGRPGSRPTRKARMANPLRSGA